MKQFVIMLLFFGTFAAPLWGQESTVTGTIVGENQLPLPAATIKIKTSSTTALSDAEGKFSIKAATGQTLVVSYAGYDNKEVVVRAGMADLLVTLVPFAVTMPDVVVNKGYYSTSAKLNTGSVSVIKSEDIAKQPVTNPLSAIQGRMAGVLINQTSGVPGAAINIQIRGLNSVAAGNNPLYIVDGVPFTSTSISQINTASGAISPLNSISPADIESIEILKDADATAIYGSRGANGVVLITTKKGKPGKTSFDLDVHTGASTITRGARWLNTQDYLRIRRAAFEADGIVPTATNAPDLVVWDPNTYTDWQKVLIGNSSPVTDIQARVSGGEKGTRFMISSGYHYEGAVLAGNNSQKRGNLHFNIEHSSPDKKISITSSATYTFDDLTTIGSNLYGYIQTAPNYPATDNAGKLYWLPGDLTFSNPLAFTKSTSGTKTDNFTGSVGVRYAIINGLDVRVNAGYTRMNMRQVATFPSEVLNPTNNYGYTNYAYFANGSVQTYNLEPQLNFTKTIAKGRLKALAGGSLQRNNSAGDYIHATNFATDLLIRSLASAATIQTKTTTSGEYRYQSLFGRVGYDWDEKYVANFVVRRDGSSRFGPGKRWGNFWAAGAAWIFSEASFFRKHVHFIDLGKIRASYGTSGNDQIKDYGYLQTYTSTAYPYLGLSGLYANRLANPDYSWEVNKKMEAAIELGMFSNKLLLTVAWYRNRSNNQLVEYPLASQTGFTSYQANLPALVENRGWEFTVSTLNIRSDDFQWKTNVNLTLPKNRLLEFPGLSASTYANTYEIGKSLTLLRRFKFTHIDPATGIPRVQDKDGNGSFSNPNDYFTIGDLDPDFFGGIGNSFIYKGFNLDIYFQFQQQNGLNYLSRAFYPPGFMFNTTENMINNYWQKPGDLAATPGLTANAGTPIYNAYYSHYTVSDAIYSDASFIRLKNISLSWQIPEKGLRFLKMTGARVFVQAQNLLTITNYNGLDPETQGSIPPLKTITGGIHLSF